MEQVYSIFVFVTVVFSLLYYYLTSNYGYWKKKLVPCLDGTLPGFGNVYPMLFFKRNMADMFRDIYNKMTEHSIIGFYNLREPYLMVREPELVKTVLLKNFPNFGKNSFKVDKERDPLLAVHPFFCDGYIWKTSRQQLISAFTLGKLKYMYKSVNEACVKLEEYLNRLVKSGNGKVEVELKDLFSRFTAEVVASTGFGVEGDSFQSDKDGLFREMGRLIFEPSFVKGLAQIGMFFVPYVSKIFRLSFMPVKADRLFRKLVKDMLKHREEQGIQRPDFLQLMIQRKKSDAVQSLNEEFNDDIITSHVTTFFFDGYETSSITLSFLAYQLAVHAEVQDRVRMEVTNVVTRHGGLTYEALQEMTYVEQVLNESMRLFPALGSMVKICTEEIELVGSDGITCQVTPGTPVVIPVSALQRDPKYWPEPEKFDPERFSEENKQSRHRFVYLPFGEGPRICPGMKMAMLQMKAVIATAIQNFTWELSPRTKEPVQLDPKYFMSAAKGGLWVIVKSL